MATFVRVLEKLVLEGILIIFTLFLFTTPVLALTPGLEVRCCQALQDNEVLIDGCVNLALTTNRCTEVLKEWEKAQTSWIIRTSPEYKIIPLLTLGFIVLVVWYIKKKKSN